MHFSRFVRRAVFTFSLLTTTALAAPLTQPGADLNFLTLPDGRSLKNVKVRGSALRLSTGTGAAFGDSARALFAKIRAESKSQAGHPVQWTLMDLDSRQVIEESAGSNLKQFGASVSKIFVAGTVADKQNGTITNAQLQLMADMLVVSSNPAWFELQRQAGDGDSNRGRENIQGFTQRMGYLRTRGFQGWLGDIHGNELTPKELAEFLYDTYQDRYPGAALVWKIMHTGRTGASRAKKYLPTNVFVGGKTGTYDGPTVDPETGLETGPDGKPYKVRVRHQVIVFNAGGREYGLAVLANTGSDESAAALAGGFYRELSALGN